MDLSDGISGGDSDSPSEDTSISSPPVPDPNASSEALDAIPRGQSGRSSRKEQAPSPDLGLLFVRVAIGVVLCGLALWLLI